MSTGEATAEISREGYDDDGCTCMMVCSIIRSARLSLWRGV